MSITMGTSSESHPNFFKAEGNWYKGNLHSHTTISDGPFSPQKTIDYYIEKGYQFLCITDHSDSLDHDMLAEIAGMGKDFFLVLKGAEYTISLESGKKADLLGINIQNEIIETENTGKEEITRRLKEQGAEIIIAHPCGYNLSVRDLFSLKDYIGIEIFNCYFYCREREKAYSTVLWDELLKKGRKIWGFASDDGHGYGSKDNPEDLACSWIMVKAPLLSIDAIVFAIRKGNFYSSYGPAILDFQVKGRECYVQTSLVKRVSLISDMRRKDFAKGDSLFSQCILKLKGDEKYFRLECMDENGCSAYSNPVFL